jgi:hypothetical protein
MEITIWLLVAVLALMPKRATSSDAGFDKVRSLALLFGLIYLVAQASGA